jgi:uncharacterized protein YecA (UPF0149 family)
MHPAKRVVPITDSRRRPAGQLAKAVRQGRNEPCACGSGKKFKACCGK